MSARKWATPTVIPVNVFLSGPVMEWAQRLAVEHYEHDPDELAVTGMLCASKGPVIEHIDYLDGEAAGKLVYGWVLRSDGHRVHTRDCPEGLPLRAGDLYCIDPLVPHWTTCPHPTAELIFAVAVTPPENRAPKKLALDFRMTVIASCINQQCAERRAAADEIFSYRGIVPVTGAA